MKDDPAATWRVNTDNAIRYLTSDIPLDEVVVGQWLHLERLDDNLFHLVLSDGGKVDRRFDIRMVDGELRITEQ